MFDITMNGCCNVCKNLDILCMMGMLFLSTLIKVKIINKRLEAEVLIKLSLAAWELKHWSFFYTPQMQGCPPVFFRGAECRRQITASW